MRIKKLKDKTLSLTNEGTLTLFPVGVGSAFGKNLFQNNWLVIKGGDHILIDCGTRTPEALHRLGLRTTDIDNFLITHSHADHIGGLEEVMLMNRYVAKKKANILITRPYQDVLWNFSLKGGCGFNELRNKKELQFTDMWKPLRPKWQPGYQRETFEYTLGKINVKMVRTMHFPEQAKSWQTSFFSTALLIDDRVFFSGDTKYDPELLQFIEDRFSPEIIFHDAQFFSGGVHASVEELTALPAAIKKKMLLMHYQENWKDKINHIKEAGFRDFARQWNRYEFG